MDYKNQKTFHHFIGVHRTGKTTAAKQYVKDIGGVFFKTEFETITGGKGFMKYPNKETQHKLLDKLSQKYTIALRKNYPISVFDRSPIDVLAYSAYYELNSYEMQQLWFHATSIFDMLYRRNIKCQFTRLEEQVMQTNDKLKEIEKLNDYYKLMLYTYNEYIQKHDTL